MPIYICAMKLERLILAETNFIILWIPKQIGMWHFGKLSCGYCRKLMRCNIWYLLHAVSLLFLSYLLKCVTKFLTFLEHFMACVPSVPFGICQRQLMPLCIATCRSSITNSWLYACRRCDALKHCLNRFFFAFQQWSSSGPTEEDFSESKAKHLGSILQWIPKASSIQR